MVRPPTLGIANFHGVSGGVYKARERIHRGVLIRDYWRFRLHVGELQPTIRTGIGFGDLLHFTVLPLIVPTIVARV